MPGMCILNALPIDLGMPLPYGRDTRRVPKKMLGLVEGGGLPMVAELVKKYEEEGEEEEEEEEEQGEQPLCSWQGGAIIGSRASGGRAHGALDATGQSPGGEAGGARQQEGPGEGARRAGNAPPQRQMRRWRSASRHRRRRRSRQGGGRMLPPWRW